MPTRRDLLIGFATTAAAWGSSPFHPWPAPRASVVGKHLCTITLADSLGTALLICDTEDEPIGLCMELRVYEHALVATQLVGTQHEPGTYQPLGGDLYGKDGVIVPREKPLPTFKMTDTMRVFPWVEGSKDYSADLVVDTITNIGSMRLGRDAVSPAVLADPKLALLRAHPLFRES